MLVTRTYLELKRPEQFKDAFGEFSDIVIARIPKPLPALYRVCYRTVGEAFHWRDRWDWTTRANSYSMPKGCRPSAASPSRSCTGAPRCLSPGAA